MDYGGNCFHLLSTLTHPLVFMIKAQPIPQFGDLIITLIHKGGQETQARPISQ